MAYEKSGMFDSGDSDVREYDAAFFAEYFSALAHNGVYSTGDNLRVYADGTRCGVSVKPGRAWINGYYYALKADDGGDYPLALSAANAANPRIDRVVLRLDSSDAVRSVSLAVLTGTPASSPSAPALTRSGTIWELALADVAVAANSAVIAASGVTDKRADAVLCGVMGHKADLVVDAVNGNFAALDSNGNLTDSGKSPLSFGAPRRVELCRFTVSGVFNPASYPTSDGKYDAYLVGGGGGGSAYTGGGGGYCKLYKDVSVTANTAVTIGAGGASYYSTPTSGGSTSFGTMIVGGGKEATTAQPGNGGSGGGRGIAGFGGGNGGVAVCLDTGSFNVGTGAGTINYDPINSYDGQFYGCGGSGTVRLNTGSSGISLYNVGAQWPIPYGRGGTYTFITSTGGSTSDNYQAGSGIVIVYGNPA